MKRNSFKLLIISLVVLLLSGCAGDRQPKVKQFNSGIEKSKEWLDYNKYAKKSEAPVLDFAATTLKYKFNEGKVFSYDNFSVDDPQVTIQTKWHNCKVNDLYEFKFYMPDGRLYHYDYFKMKKVHSKYTLGKSMYIKGLYPATIQGKWKVEVIANSKLVMQKEFYIGDSDKMYKKANTEKKVGVFPFLDDSKMSTWKHSLSLSGYIAWSILDKKKTIQVVLPKQVMLDLANINVDYESFENQIKEDLASSDSALLEVARKHSLDYMILGRVQSYWQNGSSSTKTDIFKVDVSTKKIISSETSTGRLNRSDFNIGNTSRVLGMHPNRIKVYKQILKDINL